MADSNAIGFSLKIDDSQLKKLDEIDKKINQIATDSDNMAKVFTSAMTRMGTGADGLLKKLQAMQTTINKLDISKFAQGVQNVGRGTTQVEQFANAIAKAAEAINKYNVENRKRTDVDNSKQIAQLNKEIEAMRKRTQQLEEYIAKQREAGQGGRRGGSSTTNADTKALNAYNRAMAASEALVTQRINKIAKLRNAEEQLRNASGNYATQLNRISQEIARLNRLNEGQVDSYGRVIRSQRQLVNTSQQLTRQLALLFSVSQIEGYISKLIQVRGEFELQNTALASILQNKDQADRLFAQITELAVRSPFTVKELTTYTKSLSAYQVEYEKLYDTTKMLADVSAGLGVDMQRLILAFGQVKAANILRGTEVRQFTEAGLNILGELAKYYSELEGRMISVGEVQDMVTRRMVSFGDVEEVFKRVTSEGGIFYDMQERQAETLAGMMSNLQDRIDLMLNQIGKDNQETIKSVISFIGNLLENYDAVVAAIQAAGGAFVLYKLNVLEANKVLIRYAVQQNIVTAGAVRQLSLIQLLRVGFLRLSTALKTAGTAMKAFAASNVWLLALTAIGTAIYEIVTWNNELNEQLDGINKKYNEQSASLIKVSEAYKEVTKRAKEATSAQSGEDIYKEQFAQLQKLNEMLEDRGYRLPIHIELVTPDNIDEAFASGQEMLQLANDFSAEFQKALAVETNAAEGWFNIFGDNLASDLKDLSDSYSQVGGSFKANLDILENEVIVASKGLQGAARGYYEELRKGQKENETDTEWTMRRLTLISDINDLIRISNNSTRSGIQHERLLNQLLSTRTEILENEREVQYELDKVMNDLINKYGGIDNLKKQFNDNPLVIRTEIDRAFEQMELDAQTKRFAAHWASNRLQIPIEFTEQAEMPTFYNDWRDTVKAIDTSGIFEKQLQSMSDITDLESELQKAYSNAVKELDVYNRANADRLDLTKQIEEQEEKLLSSNADEAAAAQLTIKNLKEQRDLITQSVEKGKEQSNNTINTVKALATAFNLNYLSPTSGGSKNDPALERLKEQVAMIEKAAKAYEDYRKLYDEETAQRMVETAFANPFENLDLNFAMTFDAQGIIEAYRKLAQSVGGDAQEYIEGKIAEGLTDVTTDQRTKEVEEYRKRIDELFQSLSNYQELEKLGLNKDLISQLFGINVSSINDVQDVFEKIKVELKEYGNEGGKLISEAEKKITDAQQKELENRIKKFAEYLKISVDEIKNVQLEAGIDIQYAGMLFGQGKLDSEQYSQVIKNVISEMNSEISKINVEKFKESSEYIKAMGDLSLYSRNELRQLSEQIQKLISNSAGKIDASDLKVYQDALQNINEQMKELDSPLSNNPFKQFNELKRLQQEFNEEKERYNEILERRNELEIQLEQAKLQLQNLQNQQRQQPNIDLTNQISGAQNTIVDLTGQIGNMTGMLNQSQGIMSSLSSQAGGFMGGMSQSLAMVDAIVKGVYQSINATLDMFYEIKDLASTFGADVDEGAWSNWTLAAEAIGEMNENVMGSWESFKSGDMVGASVKAFSAVSSVVKGINKIHDNKRENKIKKELELIDDLQYAYEKLGEAVEEAYSLDTLKEAGENAEKNLIQQRNALERSIALERDKKNEDEERIKEWEREIDEINEQIEELEKEQFSKITGGILDDVLSAADEFTDAWLESFREVGDGMDGLEKNFQEMLESMLKRQASMLITGTYIDQWKKELEKYINADDLELTAGEAKNWVDAVTSSLPGLNQALEEYFKAMQQAGFDLTGEGEGDTLTGLQRGIQSLSEPTGQALEALCESIRLFTSDSNAVLHNIYNFLLAPPAESPLMQEMRVQTTHLASIDSLLGSVIKNSSGKGRIMRVEIV